MSLLNEKVLVVNRGWTAIEETTVQTALCDCVRGVACAIDTESMCALKWEDWVKLGVREGDRSIHTVHFQVRVPTVICKSSYVKIPPVRKPKFNLRNIAARDGFTDQYSGKRLTDPSTWSMDHVIPRSRGGKNVPENVVLTHKQINREKGAHTPEELGWKRPKPRPLRSTFRSIEPRHPDWQLFLPS